MNNAAEADERGVAFVVNPVDREPGGSRVTRVRLSTALMGLLVVAILMFVAWKLLDLASVSEESRADQSAFAAIEREIEVHHRFEWEAFATGVSPKILAGVQESQNQIASVVAALEETKAEDGPAMDHALVDLERVATAIDREFRAMAAGDWTAAERIHEEETDPAFADIRQHLQVLSAAEAHESQQALNGLRAGTALGLGGAGAGILALLCILAYITRKAAERQRRTLDELRQSQKMDAVGQLAGGVAHDFNNLLTAISGYSELALSRLDDHPDPELRGDIEAIARSGERAAELTRQLLALSRRQTLQPKVFDLNGAVTGTEGLLRRLLGSHIAIETTLDPGECSIKADHGQIEQIIMNLALNARDAMDEGGVLRIETEVVRLSSSEAQERFHAPADAYVILRVVDDGVGMDEETCGRAFEPFFTTKAPGEGTGLGLATVYGIAGQSGGYLSLVSEPGEGTTFELLLPHLAAGAPAANPTPAPATSGGSERILLVEDEEVVRNFTQILLTRQGYAVTVATTGAEALELFREHEFDLVITDMVMPQMSGKALAERLEQERPGLPIIFISGYAHDISGGDAGSLNAFLQKPFSAHDLATTIRESLDQATVRAA